MRYNGDARIPHRECKHANGVERTRFQSITPTEAQLSSVSRSMNFENDQDGPKSLQLLPSSQGVSLQSGSQVEPIA